MANVAAARRQTNPVLAAALAWILPGAGHWYIGRPARAVVLFLVVNGLFWGGVAIGGVFTVNPRDERWWFYAQSITGASAAIGWERQQLKYNRLLSQVDRDRVPLTRAGMQGEMDAIIAREGLAMVLPGSDVALICTGVAGMLNLLCIFDALLLSLMGRYGESGEGPRQGPRPQERRKERV